MMDFDQIPEQALAWIAAGKEAALATVVQTWGSAPRQAGSQLAISSEMEIMGSVSGGCVEGAVVEAAMETLADGIPQILEYGVSDEQAFAVGLACGGKIRILVEPVGIGQGPDVALIEQLVQMRCDRKAAAYTVDVKNWQRAVISPNPALAARFADDKSSFDGDTFIAIHNPPLRLIVVGAVHIAQPLLQMARLNGFDTTLVDPREAFATPARFPNQTLVHDWPDVALQAAHLDARTAVVTLSHDPKIDDPAIRVAMESNVFYLGSLGSTRTHAKRVARLDDPRTDRVHAPVGLSIGAKTPAEIATSIIAEIVERLRKPDTRR